MGSDLTGLKSWPQGFSFVSLLANHCRLLPLLSSFNNVNAPLESQIRVSLCCRPRTPRQELSYTKSIESIQF